MNRIIVSRTDSIGDVVLTLPMCSWLKEKFPDCKLTFLGKEYTRSIVEAFSIIDEFISEEELLNHPIVDRINLLHADVFIHVFPNKIMASLAKKARIPTRIGTSHRAFHLLTCNKRVGFTRKRSDFHESQLNFHLLKPLGLEQIPMIKEIKLLADHFQPKTITLPEFFKDIDLSKAVILHPKSSGSALEWPLDSYIELCNELIKKDIPVIFTGTQVEGISFRHLLPTHSLVIDSSGKLSLSQLIFLISKVKALVACSTGPYHIAGICNIRAVGLFSERRPIHPGRWHALGKNSFWLTHEIDCPSCKKGKLCRCIEKITVSRVLHALIGNV